MREGRLASFADSSANQILDALLVLLLEEVVELWAITKM